jgi:hypothetical protein
MTRDELARRNVDAAIHARRDPFVLASLTRGFGGYTVTFRLGDRILMREGIEEGILEDDPSPRLEALLDGVRTELANSS